MVFHVQAKNERFTAASLRVVRTHRMKISRRYLADYVKTLHRKACRTCSTIIFCHSTNQIINLWRCRCRCCLHFLNSLIVRLGRSLRPCAIDRRFRSITCVTMTTECHNDYHIIGLDAKIIMLHVLHEPVLILCLSALWNNKKHSNNMKSCI